MLNTFDSFQLDDPFYVFTHLFINVTAFIPFLKRRKPPALFSQTGGFYFPAASQERDDNLPLDGSGASHRKENQRTRGPTGR